MQINLSGKINEHFDRLEELSKEAADDTEGSFSSRGSAMSALTRILSELTKAQTEIYNMERLMRIEAVTIEVLGEFLTPDQQEDFLQRLEKVLDVS